MLDTPVADVRLENRNTVYKKVFPYFYTKFLYQPDKNLSFSTSSNCSHITKIITSGTAAPFTNFSIVLTIIAVSLGVCVCTEACDGRGGREGTRQPFCVIMRDEPAFCRTADEEWFKGNISKLHLTGTVWMFIWGTDSAVTKHWQTYDSNQHRTQALTACVLWLMEASIPRDNTQRWQQTTNHSCRFLTDSFGITHSLRHHRL